MYMCTICNHFAGNSFAATLRHMSAHRYDAGLTIKCGINSCPETYTVYESFRSHVYRKHREALVRQDQASSSASISASSENHPLSETDDATSLEQCSDDREEEDRTDTEEPEDPAGAVKRQAALFLFKTREVRKVTQCALDGIVQDLGGLWTDCMEQLQVHHNNFVIT